jgi:hypothetical protein
MSFIQKAMEASEKAFDAAHGAAVEWNAHRHASNLLLKLGIAVYAEQRLGGSHEPVERILAALDGHAAEYQEIGLDHLRAAHEVLGNEIVEPRHAAAAPTATVTPAPAVVPTQPEAPAQPAASASPPETPTG